MFSGIHINSTTDHFYEYELEKVLETKNLAKMFIHYKEFLKMNYISLKFFVSVFLVCVTFNGWMHLSMKKACETGKLGTKIKTSAFKNTFDCKSKVFRIAVVSLFLSLE